MRQTAKKIRGLYDSGAYLIQSQKTDDEPLSDAAMERIENFTKNDNMTVSVTQPYPVLEPIINK